MRYVSMKRVLRSALIVTVLNKIAQHFMRRSPRLDSLRMRLAAASPRKAKVVPVKRATAGTVAWYVVGGLLAAMAYRKMRRV